MKSSPTSSIPFIAALILFSVTGWYGYSKYTTLATIKTDLAQADEILQNLETENSAVTQEYQTTMKTAIDNIITNEQKIKTIFPQQEKITDLTRMLDDFASKNHYSGNPFFINQLTYSEIKDIPEKGYQILPITMTIDTSEYNFAKFLEYIETSGSLETGVPLMAINAISLQLQDEENTLRVQLSASAFIQNS
ncbi:MAG: hypothetical protein UT55_C0031G0005 [Candidatus Peregrinibacteria bacterium GW2011_GWE2_39_6]|nr:MAG: hypothetical protein UT36_C0002G0032 [Candidatus Peregrinibacteria bacterium GW2011_GWF2_39_17]KKR25744.1 MAG: hypothetical protein UT55_C0031G0005 [Candidatus Peregrinibacteria bacterium GW2011_GWE2_39_6]HCW32137.1 hypothetical protein [Candidatus Peregrinibacteria bacterium]